jgi:hypothetical protein
MVTSARSQGILQIEVLATVDRCLVLIFRRQVSFQQHLNFRSFLRPVLELKVDNRLIAFKFDLICFLACQFSCW